MVKILLALVFTWTANAQMRVPGWFSLFEPDNQKVTEKSAGKISLSYDAQTKFGEVVGHYESSLHEAGIAFDESGDVHGATFDIHTGESRCKLRVGSEEKPHVDFTCVSTVAAPRVVEAAPKAPAAAAPKPATPGPGGTHRIDYIIEGSATSAGLTYRNAQGGTEQRDVAIPARLTIQTGAGASFFVAAQKKFIDGTLRVVVTVDGKPMRESSSSSPYGIASVSGKLAN